jgi:hypothetical protein
MSKNLKCSEIWYYKYVLSILNVTVQENLGQLLTNQLTLTLTSQKSGHRDIFSSWSVVNLFGLALHNRSEEGHKARDALHAQPTQSNLI